MEGSALAGQTDEALLRMATVVSDVLAAIDGRKPQFPVPPPTAWPDREEERYG